MTKPTRKASDAWGEIDVPRDRLWGAQTQRALMHFNISTEKMPEALIMALARVKKAAAFVNADLGLLDVRMASAIAQAADEILAGHHAVEFALSVWQTGSGTQSHMNVNEVLAQRAMQILARDAGQAVFVHPNDHVNLGQSSNDIVPTAMHMAAVASVESGLLPFLRILKNALADKANDFAHVVKIGRTHLQDATPLTLGQEISGWCAQLAHAEQALQATLPALLALAVGGTAVGTGLNTHPQFGTQVAARLSAETGFNFSSAENKFAALASHDPLVSAHGALKTLAVALMKIANDVRWLASGPRCGIAELHLPENEPGSSIMPGKVNPTQCEALTMVCCQVFGNDVAVTIGGASGHFELNVYKPLIIHNFLQSARLLQDAMHSFEAHCVRGMQADLTRIETLLNNSLMLVTALTPHIGYDQAAAIAKFAQTSGVSLRAAALKLGLVTAVDFDAWVQPHQMVGSGPTPRQ